MNIIERIKLKCRARPWIKSNGDKTLRLNYDLKNDSIVFDLGGYEGQWTNDIYSRYHCRIYCFEPVARFYQNIKNRFVGSQDIFVYNFGLADKDSKEKISIDENSSSIYKKSGSSFEEIQLHDVASFLLDNNISAIDLMKVNIEGGEFDLIERLLDTGHIKSIKNIQVQFHEFVPDAKRKMDIIKQRLSKTHYPTYQYVFVWENWKLKEN